MHICDPGAPRPHLKPKPACSPKTLIVADRVAFGVDKGDGVLHRQEGLRAARTWWKCFASSFRLFGLGVLGFRASGFTFGRGEELELSNHQKTLDSLHPKQYHCCPKSPDRTNIPIKDPWQSPDFHAFPSALNPKPHTLNPKPRTLTPEP